MNRQFYPSRSGADTRRSGKYIAWVAVAVAVIALLAPVTNSYGMRADLSDGKLYSLSDRTMETIEKISSGIQIFTLYSPGNDDRTVNELLNAYCARNRRISVTNVNPSGARREIERFDDYESMVSGTLIVFSPETNRYRTLSAGELYYTIDSVDYFNAEAKLTAAVEFVTTGAESRIYLLSGHREADAEETRVFTDMLGASCVEAVPLDLLKGTVKPDPESDVIYIIAPGQDISSDETDYLKTYIEQKGQVVLFADSSKYTETGEPHPNLTGLLSGFGIRLSPDMIYDSDGSKTGLMPYVIELERSAVSGGGTLVLEGCTPIYTGDAEVLLATSETAYTEKDGNAPFTAGAVCADGALTVISSASFLLGRMPDVAGNADFITYLLGRSGIDLSGFPAPKRIDAEPMTVTYGMLQVLLAVLLLVLLPGGVLAAGVFIIKKRREKSD